jgi:hypothetical protein
MTATRPLVLVVSLLPAFSAVLQGLKLSRHPEILHGWAFGVAFLALGALAGSLGALQFGRGVPDPDPRRRHGDDDDEMD